MFCVSTETVVAFWFLRMRNKNGRACVVKTEAWRVCQLWELRHLMGQTLCSPVYVRLMWSLVSPGGKKKNGIRSRVSLFEAVATIPNPSITEFRQTTIASTIIIWVQYNFSPWKPWLPWGQREVYTWVKEPCGSWGDTMQNPGPGHLWLPVSQSRHLSLFQHPRGSRSGC